MSSFKEIQAVIDEAIEVFDSRVPGVQNAALQEIMGILKEMEVRNGKIINSVKNLKYVGTIKNKLRALTLSNDYKSAVRGFLGAFDIVAEMQDNYFRKYVSKFKIPKQIQVIKSYSIDQTIFDLMGQGLVSEVVDPVHKLLQGNIAAGGSYLHMQKQVEDYLINNDSGSGRMLQYTRQICTDAIHQYNAQYHGTLAQEFGFKWGRYVGSDIETTREFCDHMTDKDYFHVSELPDILKGKISDHQCRLSKTTGLPLGMIPGTDVDNFKIRRGGYNCRHGVYMIPDSAVPASVKAQLKS